MQSDGSHLSNRGIGDIAVDGLLYGLAAGSVMIGFLMLLEWVGGTSPADLLRAFGPRPAANPVNGLLSHLAVSAVYGILWAFLVEIGLRRLRTSLWLAGILYGLVLYILAAVVIVQNTALVSVSAGDLLAAHLAYGLVLGLLSARR